MVTLVPTDSGSPGLVDGAGYGRFDPFLLQGRALQRVSIRY